LIPSFLGRKVAERKKANSYPLILVSLVVRLLPAQAAEGGYMSLFKKKQEVDLDTFCRDFYEKNIINPVIQGIDAGAAFVEVVKRNIVEVDATFSNIDSQKLAKEWVLLRFELFALAWLHQFGERLAVAQSVFTKSYLHEKGRDDIWDN
jgi:hypothetical protein